MTENNSIENESESGKENRTAIRTYKGYNFWYDVKKPFNDRGLNAKDYIALFLKERFPRGITIGQYFEFNRIDMFVVKEELPVEIQSTAIDSRNNVLSSYTFEHRCRNQIEENIKTVGKCWFFFDEEFLRYLQTDITTNTSLQLDWLYKLMKEEKLKVFTLNYKGEIKERILEDFNFISKISTTCEIGKDSDRRILAKNKHKILKNLVNYYRITQDEIDEFGKDYFENHKPKQKCFSYMESSYNKRKKIIGLMLRSLGNIDSINEMFDGKISNTQNATNAVYIGLFESNGKAHGNMISFVDSSDIAQYFPTYLRNKEKWDKLKGRWTTPEEYEICIKLKPEETLLKYF